MPVFGAYSRYYNLLYKDKDYAGETDYVLRLIEKHHPGTGSILDLGCGTGKHDLLLAQKGYDVTGVDRSEEMLAEARANAQARSSRATFLQGDVRTVKLDKTFDAVISLFHVMSYQATNEDLAAAFATVRAHLKSGGLFIFDCWYGPAVLTDRPSERVKRLEDESISVARTAKPVMHPNENLVDVNYRVVIQDKTSGNVEEINETHRMRYLFKPEVEVLLRAQGLTMIHCEEWMTGKAPGFDTWSACFVGTRT